MAGSDRWRKNPNPLMEKLSNYINGNLVDPTSGIYFDNINPATGQVYSQIPDSEARDVDLAVEAASLAFSSWSSMPVKDRSDIMLDIANRIDVQLHDMAEAESIDNGKPLKLARAVDIPRASSNFRFLESNFRKGIKERSN